MATVVGLLVYLFVAEPIVTRIPALQDWTIYLPGAASAALGVELAETVFEPRMGDHIYDRAVDGSDCRWARVLAYDPPQRVMFSWDLGPDWQVESDPDRTSEVDVRFIAQTPQRTRVELEHRHVDRHGDGWQAVSDGVGSEAGWPLYL